MSAMILHSEPRDVGSGPRIPPADSLEAANEPWSPGEWLTPPEAAAYLRLPSVRALYQRRARGQVKACLLGRSLRFRRRELDALLARGGRSC